MFWTWNVENTGLWRSFGDDCSGDLRRRSSLTPAVNTHPRWMVAQYSVKKVYSDFSLVSNSGWCCLCLFRHSTRCHCIVQALSGKFWTLNTLPCLWKACLKSFCAEFLLKSLSATKLAWAAIKRCKNVTKFQSHLRTWVFRPRLDFWQNLFQQWN